MRFSFFPCVLHVLPFLIFFFFFLVYVFSSSFRSRFYWEYYIILYTGLSLSWILYSLLIIFYNIRKNGKESTGSDMLLAMSIVLFSMGIYAFMITTAKLLNSESVTNYSGAFIFICWLLLLIIVYVYSINRFIRLKSNKSHSSNTLAEEMAKVDEPYQKSRIQEDKLQDYLELINKYMDEEKPFLDPQIRLDQLASHLKIYKHHLSQVFNREYGQSFTEYINVQRVKYACSLLEDTTSDIRVEELSERCGFNSQASFYRNFSQIMKCTPKEYRKRFREIN